MRQTHGKTIKPGSTSRNTAFITIHGVGNHSKGENAEAVRNTLQAVTGNFNDADIKDFFWSDTAKSPLNKDQWDNSRMLEVTAACLRCTRLRAIRPNKIKYNNLSKIADSGLAFIETAAPIFWLTASFFLLANTLIRPEYYLLLYVNIIAKFFAALVILTIISAYISGQNILEIYRGIVIAILLPLILLAAWILYWFSPATLSEILSANEKNNNGDPFNARDIVSVLFWPNLYAAFVLVFINSFITNGFVHIKKFITLAALLFTIILFKNIIGGTLKVLSDVSMYFGNDIYRNNLKLELDRMITSYDPSTKIFLLAHSLGSVIALDSLLTGQGWTRNRDVVLVTAGSPIKRMVWKFFPGSLIGNSPEDCSQIIASRVRTFAWINIYRRFDYIGKSLGLSSAGVGLDILLKNWRVFPAHIGYWCDKDIINTVLEAYCRLKPVNHKCLNNNKKQKIYFYEKNLPLQDHLRKKLIYFLYALAVLPGVVFISFTFYISYSNFSVDALLDPNLSEGRKTTASITYHKGFTRARDMIIPVHEFVVYFKIDERDQEEKFSLTSTDYLLNYRFDAIKLTENADCKNGKCQINDVNLKYLPSNPNIFVLSDYPATYPRIKYVLSSLNLNIASALLAYGFYSIIYYVIGVYFHWLLIIDGRYHNKI